MRGEKNPRYYLSRGVKEEEGMNGHVCREGLDGPPTNEHVWNRYESMDEAKARRSSRIVASGI